MRCATGTPATGAHINAHTNAHINAHIIFPRTSVTSEWRAHHFASCAHHFAWSRTPFLPAAQAILLGGAHHFACCPSPAASPPRSLSPRKGDWQPESRLVRAGPPRWLV